MYSFSKSFRELKNAIKFFFLCVGGLGAKLSFKSKKKHVDLSFSTNALGCVVGLDKKVFGSQGVGKNKVGYDL